ncbi:ABC transporter permease subunit [Candidatus Chlorohelix sp.]|uniref:ABC transporter permease subunit n=1 Tax=Candidatus Chlorohelix sp. TaxID=3139201 RepID=UPI00302D1138
MHRTLVIFRREWKEMRKNRTLLQTLAILPLILVLLPMGLVVFFNAVVLDFAEKNRAPETVSSLGLLSGDDNVRLLAGLVTICFTFFLPLPAVLPMTIAANSVVNEKEKRSLEPLLATPVTTNEILWGKSLSAIVPGVVVTWGSFILLVVVLSLVLKPNVFAKLDLLLWFAIIGFWSPALATWATLVGVAISSRAKDARAASQAGSLLVIPLIIFVFGVTLGFITVNWLIFVVGLLVWVAAAAITFWIAGKLFDRETILTRWK